MTALQVLRNLCTALMQLLSSLFAASMNMAPSSQNVISFRKSGISIQYQDTKDTQSAAVLGEGAFSTVFIAQVSTSTRVSHVTQQASYHVPCVGCAPCCAKACLYILWANPAPSPPLRRIPGAAAESMLSRRCSCNPKSSSAHTKKKWHHFLASHTPISCIYSMHKMTMNPGDKAV